ncbi:MAG: KTSC domain-containing protein [Chthoniobacteraceae bacterium]
MNSLARACGVTRRAALRRILGAPSFALLIASLAAQQGEIKRQPVESSVLAAVGYDAQRRLLEIEFHSGAIYRYLEVPEEIHRRLLAAESKGRFFGAAIRDKFRSEHVKPRTSK